MDFLSPGVFGGLTTGLITSVFFGVLFLYPFWRCLSRAGYKPAWSLVILVPFVGFFAIPVLLGVLALGNWPAIVGPAQPTSWRAVSRTEWLTVPREEAVENRYYGLDGWLLLMFVMSVMGIFTNSVSLFAPLQDEAYQEFYGMTSEGSQMIALLAVIWSVILAILIPLKHQSIPKLIVLSSCLYWAVYIAISIVYGGEAGYLVLIMAPGSIFLILYNWYWLKSKRVNVTYRHRVPVAAKNQA